jgi:hypothetical protein
MVPQSLILAAQGVGDVVRWRARAPAGYDPDAESSNGPPQDVFEDLLVVKPGVRPWVGAYVVCVKGEYKGWIQIVKNVLPYNVHLNKRKWPSGIKVEIQTAGTGHNQVVDLSLLRSISSVSFFPLSYKSQIRLATASISINAFPCL